MSLLAALRYNIDRILWSHVALPNRQYGSLGLLVIRREREAINAGQRSETPHSKYQEHYHTRTIPRLQYITIQTPPPDITISKFHLLLTMVNQTPTYHLPPNFSINPPPLGPIDLGTIVSDLQSLDVVNQNRQGQEAIPPARRHIHSMHGFTATRYRMRSGEFGIWAKLLAADGIGGEISHAGSRTNEIEYRFGRLDTISFSPSAADFRDAMRDSEVAEFVEASNLDPVYMVTGLKIAVEPSVNRTQATTIANTADLGVQQPGGLPVEFGPRVNWAVEDKSTEGWERSDDFIYGLRVTKLVYKRAWLSRLGRRRDGGELRARAYVKGAELVGMDDDSDGDEQGQDYEILELELNEELKGMVKVYEKDDGGEAAWVVPAAFH